MTKRLIRQRRLRKVVATLKSGASFTGVLYEADSESFILREAVAVSGSKLVPVDGEILVLRGDLDYLQVLP